MVDPAAAIVIPPATARLLTHAFGRLLTLFTAIGAASGCFGVFISFEWDIASGAAVVLLQAALFTSVYLTTALRHTANTAQRAAKSARAAPGVSPVTIRS